MKYLPLVLCLSALSSPVWAATENPSKNATEVSAESGLRALHKAQADAFLKDLKSLRGEPLRDVADQISGAAVVTPELTQALRELSQQLLEEQIATGDKIVANELNSVLRAYASMGESAEAKALLQDAVDTSTSRGVRNRAVRLIPRLSWYTIRNALAADPQYYKPSQKPETHKYLAWIASSDPAIQRFAAQEVGRDGGAEAVVYEAMFNKLEQEKYTKKDKQKLDALAWFAKTISNYARADYREQLAAIKGDKKVSKKIRKYTRP